MSNPVKIGVVIILAIVGVYAAIALVGSLLKMIVPIAIFAAIGLILYGVVTRKSLGGGGRSLP